MNLVVEETKAGDKIVVLEPHDEFPVDHQFVRDIDEALFTLSDLCMWELANRFTNLSLMTVL